jgi:hypothetical protein
MILDLPRKPEHNKNGKETPFPLAPTCSLLPPWKHAKCILLRVGSIKFTQYTIFKIHIIMLQLQGS